MDLIRDPRRRPNQIIYIDLPYRYIYIFRCYIAYTET